MSVRRILAKTIDTDLEYEAIGIDLAKNCVSAALLTTDGEVVCIDRLDYSELEKSAQALSSTTFAMEPCTEMNYLVPLLSKIICSLTLASTFTVNPGPRKLKVINKPLLIK